MSSVTRYTTRTGSANRRRAAVLNDEQRINSKRAELRREAAK
jgi:hypothetical protein